MTLKAKVDTPFDVNMRMGSLIYEDHVVTLSYPTNSAPGELVEFNGASVYTYTDATWAADQQVNITIKRGGVFFIPYVVTTPYSQRIKKGTIRVEGEVPPNVLGQFNLIRPLYGSTGYIKFGKVRVGDVNQLTSLRVTLLSAIGAGNAVAIFVRYPGYGRSISFSNGQAPYTFELGTGVGLNDITVWGATSVDTRDQTTAFDGVNISFEVIGANGNGNVVTHSFSRIRLSTSAQEPFIISSGNFGSLGLKAIPGASGMQPIQAVNGKFLARNPIVPAGWISRYVGEVDVNSGLAHTITPSGNGLLRTISAGTATVNLNAGVTYLGDNYSGGNYPRYDLIPTDAVGTEEGTAGIGRVNNLRIT